MGLFAAVDRCASGVSRHAGRIIYLRYKGSASAEKTVYLVGKGVTYDTGGADIKAGGVMAGMHRDKCGSAAVAAFMKVVAELQPKNIEGRMAMSDVLCKLKEEAVNAVNPQLMTIATLTGHACLAVGEPYSIIMDNGPAARLDVAKQVQHSGHV